MPCYCCFNNSSNQSLPSECHHYQNTHYLHMVFYSLVLATGLPLNALALWIFTRAIRVESVVSIYMCNLAASDLLFTLSLPLRISYYALHSWVLPSFLCQVAGAIFQMNMYGSCLFLTLINVDRYVAIVHPLRLRHLRRPRIARLLCLGIWLLILVFAVPTVIVHKPTESSRDNNNRTTLRCFEGFHSEIWRGRLLPLVVLAETLGFLLPLGAVVYSSGRVFWTLARPDATRSQRRRKTVRLLLANLVIFLLCFVPYNATLGVYGLLRGNLVEAPLKVCCQVRNVLMVLVLLASSNCVLDPLVYYFSAEGFRNILRDMSTPVRARTLVTNGVPGTVSYRSTEITQDSSLTASKGLLRSSDPDPGGPFTLPPEDSAL
ncbi:Lysophosphatidic acid receptor 5 [Galemys pyrenaicus]|uniref:Lysophosphatidic acid receptor 5 n=1 Tax=Galemys pyrenaicus TaxID=202257 RepID=A0A8J6AD41_GALPY|nr:Lysophosphatidic acid receptor 5 [Galemys pyrenaicus]